MFDHNAILLVAALAAGIYTLGVLSSAFLAVVFYHYGSSAGSRTKDAVIAGQLATAGPVVALPPPVVAIPAPKPAPAPVSIFPPSNEAAKSNKPSPATAAAVPTMTLTGKMSVFGGPDDTGMAPDEGLALYEPGQADQIAGFLLPQQPPGTTGLGRRLDPSKFYIACRFDYSRTPKAFLRTVGVHVTAQGKTINCRPVDWGPNANTGRIADLSPGAAAALGIHTDDTVTVTIPLPKNEVSLSGKTVANVLDSTVAAGEPAWLTAARAEIGFHEQPNNTGIQKFIDQAGYGAEGQPWCAIFAGAMLRKAGVDITGCNAMARSFATSPAFTKTDACPGAIAVFWRGSPTGGEGHVGFAVGEDATHVQVLGGNENDQVMIEALPKNSATMGLLGYWWPNATPPATEPKLT